MNYIIMYTVQNADGEIISKNVISTTLKDLKYTLIEVYDKIKADTLFLYETERQLSPSCARIAFEANNNHQILYQICNSDFMRNDDFVNSITYNCASFSFSLVKGCE